MVAGTMAFFFDFDHPVQFVCVGFDVVIRVIEPGDCVEARALRLAAGKDDVGHAYNGSRVHAAAQFSEHGSVRAKPPPYGLGEDSSKMFLIFGVGAVADSFPRIKFPIPGYRLI